MIGQKLSDRYEIVSELGRGGMGVVYRAHDPRLNRQVAVKLIPPSLLTEVAEQRFQIEAQLVAQMDHPSIVSIYDFGRHEGSLFFVMPIIQGTDLRQLMRDQSLLLGDVIDTGIEVAEALEYSHARGVVHRDIKPENVMVHREQGGALRVRVMDFGLARNTKVTRFTKTGMLLGTMAYISPEQVLGDTLDGRSDVYSLGTVLYECMTNEVPFTGEMQSILYRIVHETPQPPRALGAGIGEELEGIILSCLAKDAGKRPQKAAQLAELLRSHRGELRESERMKSVTVTRTVQTPRHASPFVGRKKELKELHQRLNNAVAGECQFLVISGEPGVGKTRLLDELENLARARQIRVLHGRSVDKEAAFPYHGFCEAIQEYFRQKEFGSAGSGLPDLSDLGADLISLFPMLSEVEAIRAAVSQGSGPVDTEGGSRSPENRIQIFELMARTLIRLAGGKPLVLLMEDLHRAEVSIEALQYVVRRLGPTPTLIVGTYRSTEVDRRHPLIPMLAGFQGDRRFSSIALEPFSTSEHRLFLATLVGGSEVTEELVDKLYEGSEGNPFFAKELIRSLLDAGSIAQDDAGAWALSGGSKISSDSLPATIQQAVEKRIDRLPGDLRQLLSTASVMGKTFHFRDLEALTDGEGDLDDAVDRLVQEGLVEEDRQSRGDRLTFSSGVIRDVLYSELSRRKRRSLHRKYAQELEKRHSGRMKRVYPQLVYHFSEGDVPEKTVEYGLHYSKSSLEAFSSDEAIRSAKTALEFLDEEWEGDRSFEAEARMLLARGYQMHGEVNGALKEIQAAIRIFEKEGQPDRTVSALLVAARTAWQVGQTGEARRWVERGLEAARAAGQTEDHRQFLSLAATLAGLRGEYTKASEYLSEAEKLGSGSKTTEAKEELPSGGRLVVALANPLAATEPATIKTLEEGEVHANVFEPLLSTDPEGNLIPKLCEKWEVRDSGRSFLLTLRSGIRFHDDHELTAEDIKRSFEMSIRQSAPNLPAAFAPIQGLSEFAEAKTDSLAGIVVRSKDELEIKLEEPLPIYPALLTDERAAIIRRQPVEEGPSPLVGTGPFRLVSQGTERIVLERNTGYWTGTAPNVDAVEFRPGLNASAIASGLRSGELDVARDLSPRDLEEILRDPRFRGRLTETRQKITYFILFNSNSGPIAAKEGVRKALSGIVRARDLVWETLGRFAQPAAGLLPPGILGHDPGKRPRQLSLEQAKTLLSSAGLPASIELKASVHPLIQDRYGSLLKALFSVWEELGVRISVQTSDMASFLDSWKENKGLDLCIMRWIADYDDPDNFTHTHFRSGTGILREYYCSPEADRILEEARAERQPTVRESLYRKFENMLVESGVLVPLFHDVDYRIASPRVRALKLRSSWPQVNYSELGKSEETAPAADPSRETGGIIRVPVSSPVTGLDPTLSETVEDFDVLPSIYETLIRDVGEAQIVPWLAEEFWVEEGGKRYRFRLRKNVHFHDGRSLTARDVRYSLERLLGNVSSSSRWLYSPILGARELLNGQANDLAGFHIYSTNEFAIELERPVSFFLALLSYTAAAIVPEGTERFGRNWQEGATGTGPFRVTRFDQGTRLELERNPAYWREGYPRSQGLIFTFGVSPGEILSGFRAGRFSLASDLFPHDVEALRRDTRFAAGYREAPRLSTYFLAFNTRKGPLADESMRRKLLGAVDAALLVRQALGPLAIPAHGLIPPGLLGYEPAHRSDLGSSRSPMEEGRTDETELTAAVHPVFRREYSAVFDGISEAFRKAGVKIRPTTDTMDEFLEAVTKADVDLALTRWIADYPDADTFAHVLQTEEGRYGPMCGSPEIDRLIERGRAETGTESRHSIYRQMGDAVARGARLFPLFHEQVYRFARPEVEGLSVSYCFAYEDLRVRGR